MSAPSDPLDIIKPLISAITEKMRSLLGLLMIHTIFGAMLVPLLIALIYFSNARTRRMPLFWVILFDICLGLAVAIWDDSVMLTALFNPQNGIAPDSFIAFPVVQSLSTWVVDLTLLMRLIAVFPYSSTPKPKFVALLVFPTMVKITRLGLIAASVGPFKQFVMGVSSFSAPDKTDEELARAPMVVAEFFCELADHLYVSTLFLYKLYRGFSRTTNSGRVTSGGRDSFTDRIRSLFYIALANFIFPVFFNIVLIIIYYSSDASNVIFIVPSNTYVTIFGVVFATIWNHASHHGVETSSTPHYVKAMGTSSNSKPFSALEFKHDDGMTTRTDAGDSIGTGMVGGGPKGLINPRGNGGSGGTLAFDNLHFSGGSKSSRNESFLDITVHEPGVSMTRDTAGVIHRV